MNEPPIVGAWLVEHKNFLIQAEGSGDTEPRGQPGSITGFDHLIADGLA